MKKLSLLMLATSTLILGSTFAQGTTSTYQPVEFTPNFNFMAVYVDGMVKTKRSPVNTFSQDTLKYYKLVRSIDVQNPVYPDQSYIHYTSDMNATTYLDQSPKAGYTNYYAICAIMTSGRRLCSKGVAVSVGSSTSTPTNTYEKPMITTTNSLTASMKTMLDGLVQQVLTRIDTQSAGNNTLKITTLETLIRNLNNAKTTHPTLAMYIEYLVSKFNEQLSIATLNNILSQ